MHFVLDDGERLDTDAQSYQTAFALAGSACTLTSLLAAGLLSRDLDAGLASVQMVGPYAAINPIAVGNQRRPSNTGYECD